MTSTDRTSWLVLATHVGADGTGGGMVRYTVELIRGLGGLPEVETHVLVRPEAVPFFAGLLGDESRVHRAPNVPTMALAGLERSGIATASLRRRFDVVQGTKHFVPRLSRSFGVLTIHDMLMLDRPQDHSFTKRHLIGRPYLGSIRSAGALICVSEATRRRLAAYSPAGAARADVVPSAVSTSLLDATPRPVPGLAGTRFALVVGDASPRKNLRLVVDSWGDVVRAAPDAVLAVVGPPGWGRVDYGSDYESLARSGRLLPLGHIDDGELRWCYEHASVVLCPSLQEGFGLPAIEALAFGARVLTSDDPALCEVSGDAATHLSGSDGQAWVGAISDVLANPVARSNGTAALRSWSTVARDTVEAVSARRRLVGVGRSARE